MTLSEKKLWEALRKLKCNVRRQAPMRRYVADFIHHASAVVIEVDGPWHDFEKAQLKDLERDAWFQAQGYRVLRVRDGDVFEDLEGVVTRIAAAIGCKVEAEA